MKLKLLIFMALLMMSCTEVDKKDYQPELKLIVKTKSQVTVDSASVQLFTNSDDWESKENVLQTLMTDSVGTVLIKELETQKYYVYVEKDSLTNKYDVSGTSSALIPGEIRVLNITIQ
jgi:hypothetical protein